MNDPSQQDLIFFEDLRKHKVEKVTGKFQAGVTDLSVIFGIDLANLTDALRATVESSISELFMNFYEDEDLDCEEIYGSFEILIKESIIRLILHLDTEEEISLNFPFFINDYTVKDRKIIFNCVNICRNPSLILMENEQKITSLAANEFSEIFQNYPERLTLYTIGMGGDGYSQIIKVDNNITIQPDESYDWDFSEEIEAVYLAVDHDKDDLRIIREIYV